MAQSLQKALRETLRQVSSLTKAELLQNPLRPADELWPLEQPVS